jgi:four helix bundle protein
MAEDKINKQYDLEDRTLEFCKRIKNYLKEIPKTLINIEIIKQLFRSAGSVGANYIEANESLGKKDFIMRIKICRKEAKESRFWLILIDTDNEKQENERQVLIQEASELMNIFGSIFRKSV